MYIPYTSHFLPWNEVEILWSRLQKVYFFLLAYNIQSEMTSEFTKLVFKYKTGVDTKKNYNNYNSASNYYERRQTTKNNELRRKHVHLENKHVNRTLQLLPHIQPAVFILSRQKNPSSQ